MSTEARHQKRTNPPRNNDVNESDEDQQVCPFFWNVFSSKLIIELILWALLVLRQHKAIPCSSQEIWQCCWGISMKSISCSSANTWINNDIVPNSLDISRGWRSLPSSIRAAAACWPLYHRCIPRQWDVHNKKKRQRYRAHSLSLIKQPFSQVLEWWSRLLDFLHLLRLGSRQNNLRECLERAISGSNYILRYRDDPSRKFLVFLYYRNKNLKYQLVVKPCLLPNATS